jgi:hypothetical protein
MGWFFQHTSQFDEPLISPGDHSRNQTTDKRIYVVSPPIQLKYNAIFAASLEIDILFNNSMLQKTRNIT